MNATVGRPAGAWLQATRAAERRGELLEAVDLAQRGLEENPGDRALQYQVVLALARAGSTEEARRRFGVYGLARDEDEDVASLGARLEKDVALAASGEARRRHAARAARLYADVFARTRGYYPGINAATLRLLAGDSAGARSLAAEVLDLAHDRLGYYEAATEAEAHLLLGELGGAREALRTAAALNDGDLGALATTRRQLRLICDETGADPSVLSVLALPSVVHFCGHRVLPDDTRFGPAEERAAAARIREELAARDVGFGYGSLASGADLMCAEALIERGAELHAVLPFRREEFVALSVGPAGSRWVDRFERCLSAATSVTYASNGSYLGDDLLYRYAAELAMGLALLQARFLDTTAVQVALWDKEPAAGPAGTAVDVSIWRRHGLESVIVPMLPRMATEDATPAAAVTGNRVIRAILFGDVQGFSKLDDTQILRFVDAVLGGIARALDRHAGAILYRNTWGDGLVVVLTDAVAAASCALDVQEAMSRIDLAAAGLPEHLALRLGGHVGPVFPAYDPVVGTTIFAGAEMSRTAMVEPVTPAGRVYVTEPFAAQLALNGDSGFACDYVGHMPAAKDYGRLRMYVLHPRR